jgi:hypothetical protein
MFDVNKYGPNHLRAILSEVIKLYCFKVSVILTTNVGSNRDLIKEALEDQIALLNGEEIPSPLYEIRKTGIDFIYETIDTSYKEKLDEIVKKLYENKGNLSFILRQYLTILQTQLDNVKKSTQLLIGDLRQHLNDEDNYLKANFLSTKDLDIDSIFNKLVKTDSKPKRNSKNNSTIYAIISDIHGNISALNKFEEFRSKAKIPFENVISLGDVIGYGPSNKETMDYIISNKIKTVIGNHEQALLFKMVAKPYDIQNHIIPFYSSMNSFAKFGVDLANSQLQTLRKHF